MSLVLIYGSFDKHLYNIRVYSKSFILVKEEDDRKEVKCLTFWPFVIKIVYLYDYQKGYKTVNLPMHMILIKRIRLMHFKIFGLFMLVVFVFRFCGRTLSLKFYVCLISPLCSTYLSTTKISEFFNSVDLIPYTYYF